MLKVLPADIANLIAAGEVVARPASVVKELVENSIDAGATSITVMVTDAGRTAIRVIDNGCGMTAAEALLCFERHATSKISEAADLEKILTLGFRGEALPSIAAVAEVNLKTRTADAQTGTRVTVSPTSGRDSETVQTPVGTNIEIRNLFYNVPARRKFLKSDATELRLIVQEFLRIAITREKLSLKLISGEKEIYSLRPAQNVKQRIGDIFGRDEASGTLAISADTSVIRVSGYIGSPQKARKGTTTQYLFVNGRFFRSPYIHKAVVRPYEKLIPEGSQPQYFIFLECDPSKVDVNVHPAKTEVKFEDEPIIFDIVSAAVRESLGRNAMVPMIDFDTAGAPEIPSMGSSLGRGGWVAPPKIDFNPLFDPFTPEQDRDLIPSPSPAPQYGAPQPSGAGLFEDDEAFRRDELFVVGNRYIILKTESGITAVSISRARERIFYERYLERIVEDQPLVQKPLFPVNLPLGVEACLTLREEAGTVAAMGFDLGFTSDDTVSVNALPEGFATDPQTIAKAVDELLASIREESLSDDWRRNIAARLAAAAARTDREQVTVTMARDLITVLHGCRCPRTTSGGLPTMTTITLAEIESRI